MRKWVAVAMILFMAFYSAGCAGLQRKFTRKKKTTVKAPRIYQLKKYAKKPTPELYKKHYAYWMTWQSELISDLGQSHKKDLRCMDEILSNLNDMRNILVREKADRLAPHLDKLEALKDTIAGEDLTQFNRHYIRTTLEHEDRAIKREFRFSRVKDYLKKSFDDESEAAK